MKNVSDDNRMKMREAYEYKEQKQFSLKKNHNISKEKKKNEVNTF